MIHLLADWPNSLGVPWIGARHSLNLWTSGHCDLIVVASAWLALLAVADNYWFHHACAELLQHAWRMLRA